MASQPTATARAAETAIARERCRLEGQIEGEHLARQHLADQARPGCGEAAGQGADQGQFGEQGLAQLAAAGAQGAQHGQFVTPFVEGGDQAAWRTTAPAARVNRKMNWTAPANCPITAWSCLTMATTSTTVRLGKRSTRPAVRSAWSAARWKLVM